MEGVAPVDNRRASEGGAVVDGHHGGHGSPPQQQTIADGDDAPEFDEAAESSFLAEARERGEAVSHAPKASATAESDAAVDAGPLPPLDSLVQQIPAEVRETLEELFRAKFIRVQRVPRAALKAQ